jgi:hypothetical protein
MSKATPAAFLKIDVTKIDKQYFFKGAKGTYCDVTLMSNADGTDQYGNDGFVSQSISKEARARGERGPIIGNWKHAEPAQEAPRPPSRPAQPPVKDLRREPRPQEYNPDLDSDIPEDQIPF